MVDFVSPGVGGFPSSTVEVDITPGSGVANTGFLRPYYFPRKVLAQGHAQMFRPDMDMHIQVRGINVVTNNLELWDAIFPGAVWVIQNRLGAEMVKAARTNIAQMNAIATGDTRDSIHYFMSTTSDTVITSVGPTTFYAPLIEYGMGPHAVSNPATGRQGGPRPFMMKSIFDTMPELIQAYVDLAAFVRKGGKSNITSRPYKSPLDAYLSRWRAHMYTVEKELGDLVALGGIGFAVPGTSALRSGLLGTARVIGDLQSVMRRAIGARFTRRLTGKVTGRLIGVGSRSIFVSQDYTAGPISGGHRIYNRLAGKYAARWQGFGGFGG